MRPLGTGATIYLGKRPETCLCYRSQYYLFHTQPSYSSHNRISDLATSQNLHKRTDGLSGINSYLKKNKNPTFRKIDDLEKIDMRLYIPFTVNSTI